MSALPRKKKSSKGASSKTAKKKASDNVKVVVRMRPLNRLEKRTNQSQAWHIEDNQIVQVFQPRTGAKSKKKEAISYPFDLIFGPTHQNEDVYDDLARSVITSCMKGYHGCIFAYGQTSAGKTHTIHGSAKQPGVIPQAIEQIFNYIEEDPDREFVLRVSYMEIYNEIVNDLLAPESTNLRIREDRRLGVFVQGLKEDVVMSADQIFSLLHAGQSHRHVGRTNYNDVSSRSHTIFRIVIESSPLHKAAKGGVRTSAINIVDLAGSENAVKAGSAARLKETGYINKSLLTLGHVIYKLSENNLDHIPFRDSKLTRILQSSLGGKAKVAICCCISPSSGNLEESVSTLKFAHRAKRIVNSAKVNEKMDGATLLKKYREEIDRLKAELENAQDAQVKLQEEKLEKEQTRKLLLKNQQEKEHLLTKIEQLTRLILTSSKTEPEAPQLHRMSSAQQQPSNATQKPRLRRRVVPFMKSKRNWAATMPASALAAALAKGPPPGLERRPSFTNVKDIDEPTGNDELDELLCDVPVSKEKIVESIPDDKITDVAELRRRLQAVRKRLEEAEIVLQEKEVEREELVAQLEEKDELLKEWDTFYVTNENKLGLIKSEVQRVASKANKKDNEEMTELFEVLGMEEEEWDAPLVDYHASTPAQPATNIPKPGGHQRQQSTKQEIRFKGIIDRWKSIEQD